jgi:hypothetical protein
MKITYEGAEHEFDFDKIRVKQAVKIEKHVGVPLAEWGSMLEQGASMLALQALGWLILSGGKGAVDDADFEVVTLGTAFSEAMAAQAAAAAGPELDPADPTPPPGQPLNGLAGIPAEMAAD